MKNVDTRPEARPIDVSDVSEYHNTKTQKFEGYTVSVTTTDNCWPGIFMANPFRPPFSPHACIVSITWIDYRREDKGGQPFTYKIEYLFPNVIRKYVFPKHKMFKRYVKQPAFECAMKFRGQMLEQIKHQTEPEYN